MFNEILVAYDDSEQAQSAVTLCARLAAFAGARLHIVASVRPGDYEEATEYPSEKLSDATREECERWAVRLADAAEAARSAAGSEPLEIVTKVLVGSPGERLLEAIEAESIDLAVSGTHGLGHVKQVVVGSVSQQLLEDADCDLLFIREPFPVSGEKVSVIAGCDGSEYSQRAVQCAEQVARALDGTLVLAYVAGYQAPFSDSTFLSPKARELLLEDLHSYGEKVMSEMRALVSPGFTDVEEVVREGHVRGELLQEIEDRAPAIAVVGTRGCSGFAGLLVGSVTRDVIDHSSAPVMVVRHPDRIRQP